MTGLAQKLTSGPLDSALKAEVTDLWRDEVQPTLVTLRRDLSTTRLVRDAALSMATDARAVVSCAVGVGVYFSVGAMADLANWSPVGLAAVPPLLQSAAQTVKDEMKSREAIRTHDLYHLLAANDRLR